MIVVLFQNVILKPPTLVAFGREECGSDLILSLVDHHPLVHFNRNSVMEYILSNPIFDKHMLRYMICLKKSWIIFIGLCQGKLIFHLCININCKTFSSGFIFPLHFPIRIIFPSLTNNSQFRRILPLGKRDVLFAEKCKECFTRAEPSLIHSLVPKTKILLVLCDPIEMLFMQYNQQVSLLINVRL